MAVRSPFRKPGDAPPAAAIPRLENGDRLSRDEFERRYEAMPDLKKAELIEGEVYMPSPVRQRGHSHPHAQLVACLVFYEAGTPGVEAGDNGSVRLDLDNEPQPDAFLFIQPEHGGRVRIGDDDYVEGAPEFVAEVAASTVGVDLGKKRDAYRRNGVHEYLVWRVLDRKIDWHVNRGGRFEPAPAPDDGIVRSEVFPGLWLDVDALIRGDGAAVQAALRRGLDSPEHADFAARLKRDRADHRR